MANVLDLERQSIGTQAWSDETSHSGQPHRVESPPSSSMISGVLSLTVNAAHSWR